MGCRARLRVALRRARGTTARFRRGKKTTRKNAPLRLVPSRSFFFRLYREHHSISSSHTPHSSTATFASSLDPPAVPNVTLRRAPPAPPRPTAATTPSPERASSSRVKVEADPPRIARDSTVSRSRGRSRRGRSRRGRSRRGRSRRGRSRRGRSVVAARLSAVSSTARKMSCASATARSAASAGHAAARLRASSARRAHSAGFVDDTLL